MCLRYNLQIYMKCWNVCRKNNSLPTAICLLKMMMKTGILLFLPLSNTFADRENVVCLEDAIVNSGLTGKMTYKVVVFSKIQQNSISYL